MKKIRTALASDFSVLLEQVVLTPVLKPIFQYLWSMLLTPENASIPASEKRNIPYTKGAGRKSSFREAQHFIP